MSFIDRFFRKQKKETLDKKGAVEEQKTKAKKELIKKVNKVAGSSKEKNTVIEKVKVAKVKPKFKVDAYKILIRPLITEKISDMAIAGKYGFVVSNNANKIDVKKAIANVYNVRAIDVKMVNVRGKSVRYGRHLGKTKDWKKAIVTLAPGEKIEVYEGV